MKRIPVIASVLLLIASSIVGQKNSQRNYGESQIAENWIAAWNSHDAEKVVQLFTDDVTYEDVAFGAVNHGPAELRKFADGIFEAVPDIKFELIGSAVNGKSGSIEWAFSGTDKGVYKTGKRFTVRGVSIIRLEKGKISRNLDFYDLSTVMKQIGLLPAQDGAPHS